MRDEDINNAIKSISDSSAGKTIKEGVKWLLFAVVVALLPVILFILISLFDIVVHYDKIVNLSYPLSNVIQPFLVGLAEKSESWNKRDYGLVLMTVLIWLGLFFGECLPIAYMRILKYRERIPEFHSRSYFMYLINALGAIAYSVGYYKFWGLEIEGWPLILRIVCAWFIFSIATKGIHLLVIGYNPVLAIILSVLALLFLSYAFMFIFYSIIVIPFVICVITKTMGNIADNLVFVYWI